MADDHREAAQARIADLVAALRSAGDARVDAIVAECEALSRAVAAFHMEGIRFRMYNVDRLVRAQGSTLRPATVDAVLPATVVVLLPATVVALLDDVRRHLEAAGFHTRSHQAPG